MDPIQIIITIAVCLGALLVLGFILWLTIALVVASKAKKAFKEFDDDFDRRTHDMRRGYGNPLL